jgi:arylsulfatase A-like enzyme
MAVGFAKPHDPFFVPQEYFDLYDLDKIKLPEFKLDDLDDILTPSGKKKFKPSNDFLWVRQDEKLYKSAVRAYMATISYVDECVGIVLNALKNSKYDQNTIIVIFGDNGWHLGEKLKFAKNTGWSESTRVPLIIKTPNSDQNSKCDRVVNLMDLYPTLIELCGLPPRDFIAGRSLVPLLKNPGKKWPYPSLTTIGLGSFTVNDEKWRYISYIDGTEEVYDLKHDPMEWTNLNNSGKKNVQKAKNRLSAWIPKTYAPELPENSTTVHDLNEKETKAPKVIRAMEKLK